MIPDPDNDDDDDDNYDENAPSDLQAPPFYSLDVHDVLILAVEIAANEGHSATISTDNVQEAFEALVEEAKDDS